MKKSAVISGVGPGLGTSLVRKFASKGYQEGLLARSPDVIQALLPTVRSLLVFLSFPKGWVIFPGS